MPVLFICTTFHHSSPNFSPSVTVKAAADTVTGLYDAAETVHEISKHYVLEISRAVQNDTDHQSHLIDRALRTARIAVYRVETLIQDATAALMELRDVHEGNETDIVYGFLLQVEIGLHVAGGG